MNSYVVISSKKFEKENLKFLNTSEELQMYSEKSINLFYMKRKKVPEWLNEEFFFVMESHGKLIFLAFFIGMIFSDFYPTRK